MKAKAKFAKRVDKINTAKAVAWALKKKIEAGGKIPVKLGARKGPKARSKENAVAAAKRRGVTSPEAPWMARTSKTTVAKVRSKPLEGSDTSAPAAPVTYPPSVAKVRPNVFAEKAEAHRRRKRQP